VLAAGAGVTGVIYLNHRDDGNRDANYRIGVANIALTGGAVAAAGVTAYLYFTRPSKSSSAAAVMLAPWLAPSGVGLQLGGAL
jgi:hypothetical protein